MHFDKHLSAPTSPPIGVDISLSDGSGSFSLVRAIWQARLAAPRFLVGVPGILDHGKICSKLAFTEDFVVRTDASALRIPFDSTVKG